MIHKRSEWESKTKMFGHAMKYKECPMRNRGFNCDPVGGDCATGISDELCEAIHAAYNKGFRDGADQILKNKCSDANLDEMIETLQNIVDKAVEDHITNPRISLCVLRNLIIMLNKYKHCTEVS